MMTREKGTKNVVFNCDGCSEYYTIDSDDFYDTLEGVKKAKWQLEKERNGSWSHFCPACTEKEHERKVPDRNTKRTQPRRQDNDRR